MTIWQKSKPTLNKEYDESDVVTLQTGIEPDVMALLDGCTDPQRAFFIIFVTTGNYNAAVTARLMGYTGASAKSVGYTFRHRPA